MERNHQGTFKPKIYFLPGAAITFRSFNLATSLAREIIQPETLSPLDEKALTTKELHEVNNLLHFQDTAGEQFYHQNFACGVCKKPLPPFKRGVHLAQQQVRILDSQLFCAQVGPCRPLCFMRFLCACHVLNLI